MAAECSALRPAVLGPPCSTLFVGTSVLWDLRLIGVLLRPVPITETQQRLVPWMMAGFVLMVGSGVVLFFGDPVRFYLNIFPHQGAFWMKMEVLLAAIVFTFTVRHRFTRRDDALVNPALARVVAIVSLALWAGVGVGGRAIGFY